MCLLATACLDAPSGGSKPPADGGDPAGDAVPAADGQDVCDGGPTGELVDGFVDPELPAWTAFSSDEAACRFTWSDEAVEVSNEGTAEDSCGLRSRAGYNLTNSATWLTIDSASDPTGDPEVEYRVQLASDRYMVIKLDTDGLQAGRCFSDVGCALTGPVDAGQLRYWRIRHDDIPADTVYAEASSNMASWTPLASVAEAEVGCVFLEVGSYGNPAGANAPVAIEGVNVD